MKITRRQLALTAAGTVAVAGAVAAAPALAQNPALTQNASAAAPDWDSAARAAHLQSAQAIAKVDLPMLTEPAFHFKA